MPVTQHSIATLAQFNALANLANSKGLAQGPYEFRGPFYEVASEAEMLRLYHADWETTLPGGYAVRTDENKVYQLVGRPYSSLGSWTATGIPVVSALPVGTPGQWVYLRGTGPYVYRPAGGGFGAGWNGAKAYQVLTAIRTHVLARTRNGTLFPANDRFVFIGNPKPEDIVSRGGPTRTRDADNRIVTTPGQLFLTNLSYISGQSARVLTQITDQGSINGEIAELTANTQRWIFKLRIQGGPWSGQLKMSLLCRIFASGTAENPRPTFELLNSPAVAFTEEGPFQRFPNDTWHKFFHIDSAWDGAELMFDIRATTTYNHGQSISNFVQVLPLRAPAPYNQTGFVYEVQSSGGGNATALGPAFATVARDLADPDAPHDGMLMEAWKAIGAYPGFYQGASDWQHVGTVRCVADVGGGIWRGRPIGPMNGYIADPKMPNDPTFSTSLLAPVSHLPVDFEDGQVSSAKVSGAIPRYPFLRAPDYIDLDDRIPNGTLIREVICTRATGAGPAEDTSQPLTVRLGWMDGATFRELATVEIPVGRYYSERIYPGWPIITRRTLAYECSQPVSVVALTAGGFGYDNTGSGITIPQMNAASVVGYPVSAFQYNDTERLLRSL